MDPSIAQWMAVLDKVTHYELLGVQPGAGADAFRRAYQGFAANFHPDAHGHRSAPERESVNKIFKRGTVTVDVSRIQFHYLDFRDIRDYGIPTYTAGNEPLYHFDATVFQIYISMFF